MKSTNKPILERTVQQVLETMCFSEAVPVAEAVTEPQVIGTDVQFRGSLVGRLRLEVGKNTANSLAASFLGFRSLPAESTAGKEMVQELGNIICGRFLSQLDPCAELDIDPPTMVEPLSESSEILWHNFEVDSGAFRVAFYFDSRNSN